MKPKFRAWTEEGKVMYYDVYPFKDDTLLLSYDEIAFDEVPAIDFIPMQSTCLFDKNGNEIFEGDIVHAYSEGARLIGVIEYFDNAYCIKDKNGIYNPLWTNDEQYEIIGNIYYNPELVGEEGCSILLK